MTSLIEKGLNSIASDEEMIHQRQLLAEKKLHALYLRATVEQLKKLVANGLTFAAACAELKLKVETPAPFTVSDEKLDLPSAASIQQAALGMKVGAVSDVLRTLTGGVVFSLRNRQAADLAEFEKNKEQLTQQVLQRNRQALFNDWIQSLIRDEQVDFKIKPRQAEAEEPATAN